jgi:predicted exporter
VQPRVEPHRIGGVWFSANGQRAMLLVETLAAAFDPTADARGTAGRIHRCAVPHWPHWPSAARASIIKNRTQTEATWFGSAATAGLILLMWIAYRQVSFTLPGRCRW